MYVGRKMTTDLITVTPDTPLVKARDLLREHNIKQVPVVDQQGNLVGILTDRDIKQAWASPATTLSIYELTYVLQKLAVESVMVKDPISITPNATIERAAKILHERKIGSLVAYLSHLRWDGNVRELENTIKRLIITGHSTIDLTDLPADIIEQSNNFMDKALANELTLEEISKIYVKMVLEQKQGNKKEACKLLNINYRTLMSKLKS